MTETIPTGRIEAQARLRAKNQLTLPEPIAEAFAAQPDDVLVFETDLDRPGTATIHLVRSRFAGALTGTYGTTRELKAFLREEHAAWGE